MPTDEVAPQALARCLAKTYPRVAIIHDWLNGYRGGERVLEAIAELFPQANIFTLFYQPGKIGSRLEKHRIFPSWLNRLPLSGKFYRHLLPLFPMAVERFNLAGYDLVISSSHCVAKGVIVPPETPHFCYCHTTMRYVWDQETHYFGNGLKRALLSPFLNYLRLWDVSSSARVDTFLANSGFVKNRIRKYYRREAQVVYPFVDLDTYRPISGDRGDYYLIVSAFVPYKRIDLAIEACRRLKRKLVVVGDGPQEASLKKAAGPETSFVGSLDALELRDLYCGARALLFPGEEDFGITPLEAMACGTPVLAYGRGGATETVVDRETGLLFSEQSVESLIEAMLRWESLSEDGVATRCRARASQFSKQRFQQSLGEALENKVSNQTPEPELPAIW